MLKSCKNKSSTNATAEAKTQIIASRLGDGWTASPAKGKNAWTLSNEAEFPFGFTVEFSRIGTPSAYDYSPDRKCRGSVEQIGIWASSRVARWKQLNSAFVKLNASKLNGALSQEAASRIKNVFRMAQEAVEMPKGFRYTAFRENKSEDCIISTLMYTSEKLKSTQWVVKSALMGAFTDLPDDLGDYAEVDQWSFIPQYDPENTRSDRLDTIKDTDKLYAFTTDPNSKIDPDRQAAYWLVDILSDMIDCILDNPPNRVYEYFLADGLLRKKNLSILDPNGLMRLIGKGAITGLEALKAKPLLWKRLLEKDLVTPEQVLKELPNQLGWLAVHGYIPVERALKLNPGIQRQLERAGITIEDTGLDTADIDTLVNAVADGQLTPQKAWSVNSKVLKPLVEAKLVTSGDAYKLDPSILNWMLENHHIGRAEATKLKPRIKQEMDRKGVDWESLDASDNLSASKHINADYDEEEDDSFYVAVGDDLVIQVYKSEGKWYEEVAWSGEDAPYFRPAHYMGYLSHGDVITWIRRDFPGAYVHEMSEDEYYEFLDDMEDEDWDDEDLDSSRKLNSASKRETLDASKLLQTDYILLQGSAPIYAVLKTTDESDGTHKVTPIYVEDAFKNRFDHMLDEQTFSPEWTRDQIFRAEQGWWMPQSINVSSISEEEFNRIRNRQKTINASRIPSWVEDYEFTPGEFELINMKDYWDEDGFRGIYYWFSDGDRHIFMVDDEEPDPDYSDWEAESWETAKEWFDDWHGAEDDYEDLFSSKKLNCERAATAYFQCWDDVYKALYKATFDDDEECWTVRCLYEDEPIASKKEDVETLKLYEEWPKAENIRLELTDYFDNVSLITKKDCKRKLEKYGDGDVEINGSRSPEFNNELLETQAKDIKDAVQAKTIEFMTNDRCGYAPEDAAAYSAVDVSEVDGRIRVEVRAELSFDSLWYLLDELNPIVQQYDKDSYFDIVTNGIIDAYVEI